MCVSAWEYVYVSTGDLRGQQYRLLKPELQVVVSSLSRVLGLELRPSGSTASALNCGAISPVPSSLIFILFFKKSFFLSCFYLFVFLETASHVGQGGLKLSLGRRH